MACFADDAIAFWVGCKMQGEVREGFYKPLVITSGVPWWQLVKESACSAGDLGLIPGWERALGEGKGYPLQYSGLESSVDCVEEVEE